MRFEHAKWPSVAFVRMPEGNKGQQGNTQDIFKTIALRNNTRTVEQRKLLEQKTTGNLW
jgi:hypothetical protein